MAVTKDYLNKIYSVIIIIISIVIIAFVYRRLFYGVDFTDESFYIAIPYRFILGARPFIDEISMAQLPALLTFPFIKLFAMVTHNSDGIVLYTRHLYFFFNLFVGLVIFKSIKGYLKWQNALLSALLYICVIPFNIPNLSYNTLGIGFFTIAVFSGTWCFFRHKRWIYFLLSGITAGLAVVSYPTLIVPLAVFLFIILLYCPEKRLHGSMGFISGGLLVGTIFFVLIWRVGISNFCQNLSLLRPLLANSVSWGKFNSIIMNIWIGFKHKDIFLMFLVLAYISYRAKWFFHIPILFLLPLLFFHLKNNFYGSTDSQNYLFYYSLLAPFLLLLIGNKDDIKKLSFCIWIPSFVAAVIFAQTSNNGYINAGLGLLPGSIITSILLIAALESSSKQRTLRTVCKKLVFIPMGILMGIMLLLMYNSFYRDDVLQDLRVKIRSGPYKGLYTSSVKSDYITRLTHDIESISTGGERILFYDSFPAGYLLSSLPSATNNTWLFPLEESNHQYRQGTIDYFNLNHIYPDIIFKMKRVYFWKEATKIFNYPNDDPIDKYFGRANYRIIINRPDYTVYKRV